MRSSGARHLAGLLAGVACAVLALPLVAAQGALAVRVVDRVAGVELTIDALVAQVAEADVLLIGAPPGTAATQRVPVGLLEALAARRPNVTMALELFERDVQEPFDHFQMGHMSEAEFLAAARSGPGYQQAYKPIVDLAIAREWSMVAASVPRRIATAVAESGLGALDSLAMADRLLAAAEHACAGGRWGPGTEPGRPYAGAAWCLENETIAESIAQAYAAGAIGGRRSLVVGLVQSNRIGHLAPLPGDILRRLPGRSVSTVGIVPAANSRDVDLVSNDLAIPRYVIYLMPTP